MKMSAFMKEFYSAVVDGIRFSLIPIDESSHLVEVAVS